MRIEPFAPSQYGHPGGWYLHDWPSIESLIDFRDEQRRRDPSHQLLFILDNSAQAGYTSGHTTFRHGLDVVDLDELPEAERAAAEDLELTPSRWALTVSSNVRALADESNLDRLIGLLVDVDEECCPTLSSVIADHRLISENPARCLALPAPGPSDAIAAHPNGYFFDDVQPGEHWLLAEQLRDRFGYEICGLGATFAMYVHAQAQPLDVVQQVVSDLRPFYSQMTDDQADRWASAFAGKRWILFRYVGC